MYSHAYSYKGDGVPQSQPRMMTEEEISGIIDRTLRELNDDDPVIERLKKELSYSLQRDLRKQYILSDSWLVKLSDYLRARLLDSVVMTHDRVGTKAVSAIVADLTQQVISEKRGGSGKDSGLSQVTRFEELVTVNKNRGIYYVWVYPKGDNDNDRKRLMRSLIGVTLGDVVIGGRLARYDEGGLPEWYKDINLSPPSGYHYRLDLDPVRVYSKGILPSQLRNAILSIYEPEVRSNMTIAVSPYTEGQVDIYFSNALKSDRDTSSLGSKCYSKRDSLLLKGTAGIDWVTEKLVNPSECLQESIQLEDGRWATYYSLVPALQLCMGERHFLKWLDLSDLQYEVDTDAMVLYTQDDPRTILKAHIASGVGSEYQFEIEYSGKSISDFFLDERFDLSRVITNDAYSNQEALDIPAARLAHGIEFFNLIKKSVANLDGRHIELVLDVMSSTGKMTGINVKGLEMRGADAISRFTFRQPEKVIREEAASGQITYNSNLASSRFIGNQSVAIGSTVWTTIDNPLSGPIGQAASREYVTSLQGNRIPAVGRTEAPSSQPPARSTGMKVSKPPIKRSTIGLRKPTQVVRKKEGE